MAYNLSPEGLEAKRRGLLKLRGRKQSPEHVTARVASMMLTILERGPVPAKNRLSKEEVVARLAKAYKGKYRLRDFEYKGFQNTVITLVCPIHGDFQKKMHEALYSKTGCRVCSGHAKDYHSVRDKIVASYPHYKFHDLSDVRWATSLTVTCKKHKHTWTNATRSFLVGHDHVCRMCRQEARDEITFASMQTRFPSTKAGFKMYRQAVHRETNRWAREVCDRDQRTWETHLDHVYSVRDGWRNGIDPEIVGHVTNLRLLCGLENRIKNARSAKTKKQLLADYRNYQRSNKS